MSILDAFRLDGRVAVITGGGRGIGAAIAKAYAEAGADVVIGARTQSDMDKVVREIEAMGRRAVAVPTDVMVEEQLQRLVDTAIQHFSRLDIVVNNAGGYPPMPALDTTTAQFEESFRFNVSSAFTLSRIAAPLLAKNEQPGVIVNISSVAGHSPASQFAAYGTAKGALSLLTQELAQEFAPRIRANAIAVGSTKTDALNFILTPEVEETMVNLTPMGRLGEVEDVAACALYLAAPASSYVTGEVVAVSGGLVSLNLPMPRAFG